MTDDNKSAVKAEEKKQPSYEELFKLSKSLESQLKSKDEELNIVKAANEELQKRHSDISTRVENLEKEARREKIANIVNAAYEPEQAKEQLELFANTSMSLEDISKALAPLAATKTNNVKQAKVEYTSQVAIKNASVEEEAPTKPTIPASWKNYFGTMGVRV